MLIAVDQKDRAVERNCSLYILKPIASDNHRLRQLMKPDLSIAHMNFMDNISQVFSCILIN